MTQLFTQKWHSIGWLVVAISLVFSMLAVMQDNVINNDGVEYLQAAELFKQGEYAAAVREYKWPVYPALIAVVSTVSFMSVEIAAHWINALAMLVVLLAFLAAMIELKADQRTLWVAAAVMLLLPGLNKYRPYLIREPCYLAFYALGALYLFRYSNSLRTADKWLSAGMMMLAGLFRIEGFLFAALTPWIIAVSRQQTLGRRIGKGIWLLPIILIGSAGLGWWIVASSPELVENALQRPGEALRQSVALLTTEVSDKLFVIRQDLLSEFSSGHAVGVLVLAIMFIVVTETVGTLSIWNAIIIGWAWRKGAGFVGENPRATAPGAGGVEMRRPDPYRLWVCLVLVNITILAGFTLVKLFLTGRYPLALVLTLMMLAPFGIIHLYEMWRSQPSRSRATWLYVFIAISVLAGLEGLDLRTHKYHVRQAGDYIATHSTDASSLYSNNKILIWYSRIGYPRSMHERPWAKVVASIRDKSIFEYDFVAIRLRSREHYRRARLATLMGRPPLKVFANNRRDVVYVYSKEQVTASN